MTGGGAGAPSIEEGHIKDAIASYLSIYGSSRYQRESFDQFVSHTLPHIIKENSEIRVSHTGGAPLVSTFVFCNVRVPKPSVVEEDGFLRDITPGGARDRGITYASSILVDIVQTTRDTASGAVAHEKRFTDLQLAQIPVMVRSSACHLTDGVGLKQECTYDEGGYFIINGVEKGFVSQEKLRINYPFVFKPRGSSKGTLTCEIRSCHEAKLRSTSTLYINLHTHPRKGAASLTVNIPFVPTAVPLLDAFALMGVDSGEARALLVQADDSAAVRCAIEECMQREPPPRPREEVMAAIQRRRPPRPPSARPCAVSHEYHILTNEFLPHAGLDDSPSTCHAKAWLLAFACRRIFAASVGEMPYDDRDDYANKRVDTAGALLSLLFRQLFRVFIKNAAVQLSKYVENPRIGNVAHFVTSKKITCGLRYAFATGNWGIQKSNNTQSGVLQVFTRLTRVSPVSSLQRINTPLCREGKAPEPRQLHASSWGVVCPAETPEGAACGLMKNLAILAHIRTGVDTPVLWQGLRALIRARGIPVRCDPPPPGSGAAPVFVNGRCLAHLAPADAPACLAALREARRDGRLPYDTSLAWDAGARCVQVTSDRGCLCRPVFVPERLHLLPRAMERFAGANRAVVWTELVSLGVVEYLSKEEERGMRVAVRVEAFEPGVHTHCEIHPTLINGMCAAQIPFSDHNQAPRNCYQSAMGKQAIGVYATNYLQRMDNVGHILNQPQRPLVSTWMDDFVKAERTPSGANAMVAIMCWGGYNQEDSLIVNKTALDNGMLGTVLYRTYKEETSPNGRDVESIEFPDTERCTNLKVSNYAKLGGAAVVDVGVSLRDGDVIIGKTISCREKRDGKGVVRKRDDSTVVKHNEHGVVDMVACDQVGNGPRFVKVRTRQIRKPHTGDKLASRHGQKGVIGIVYDEKDMPFTADGLRPDIIVNPHAIPSRMTIGMLVEMLLGRECLESGNLGDGTPFRGGSVKQIADELEARGVERYATQEMYNAYTGAKMQCPVFLAPAYYQRLKHMVADKVHARSRGAVQLLTRQPVEGRSRKGGLRFGEMERDCILAHGCAATLRECLFEKSDPYETVACKQCGMLCDPSRKKDAARPGFCRVCGTSQNVSTIRLPYAMKLLLQELQALHVLARFRFNEDNEVSHIEPVFSCV